MCSYAARDTRQRQALGRTDHVSRRISSPSVRRCILTIRAALVLGSLSAGLSGAWGQVLPLPPRASNAFPGSALGRLLLNLSREERERIIEREVLRGNIPSFERRFVSVTIHHSQSDGDHRVTFFALPDYLALGSDQDHLLMPMTSMCAQRIAAALGCLLPTKKLVDEIWSHAAVRLRPQPLPPGPAMTTVALFVQHNDSIRIQREQLFREFIPGTLIAGHKKDIISSNLIGQHLRENCPHPVVIYGWHRPDGVPIQPRFNGHSDTYADYSHGVRLVLDSIIVDGRATSLSALLRDSVLASLVSDEGAIARPSYRVDTSDSTHFQER